MEQQELIELPPDRAVVLPLSVRPVAGWWGVDVSTGRYNIGYVDQQGNRGVHSVRLGDANDNVGERLNRFARQARTLIETMLDEGCPPPGVALVEQPSGAHVMPIMWYASGVAALAIYEVVHVRLGYVPRVETIPPSRWKLKAVGRGNISKPKRAKGAPPRPLEDYPVWRWARTLGLPGDASWDDADAYGIAEAARRTIAISQ